MKPSSAKQRPFEILITFSNFYVVLYFQGCFYVFVSDIFFMAAAEYDSNQRYG